MCAHERNSTPDMPSKDVSTSDTFPERWNLVKPIWQTACGMPSHSGSRWRRRARRLAGEMVAGAFRNLGGVVLLAVWPTVAAWYSNL